MKQYVKYNKKDYHPAWIFEAPFCVTRYIKDVRYLRSDGAHRMLRTFSGLEPNLKSVQLLNVVPRAT